MNFKGGQGKIGMKLYVIRHGQTNYNKQGKYNGQYDEDINETGIKQAEEAKKIVQNLDIDIIFCSPLLRTRHTCEIINANQIPVIYDERLKERDCGIYTGKEVGSFYDTDYWNYFSSKKVEGLETIQELFARVQEFLEEIKSKYPNKNILIVTHGGVARGIYFYFHELPEDGMIQKFGSNNCGMKEYEL